MAPFSDGSPQASQWPIAPGYFFDYEVQPGPSDSGTYFYHSHVGLQAFTCTGPLIVEDCGSPPFAYDEERILLFTDYFQASDTDMLSGLQAAPFKWSGETNAVLLNGKGIATGHRSIAGATDCGLPFIDVEPGKTYRFRFIGATGLSFISLALEGHGNLTIVQVDGGEYNVPISVDHLQIGSGQRFDVLFKAKTAKELRAEGKSVYYIQWETRDRPSTYTGYGVIRYSSKMTVPAAPDKSPVDLPEAVYDWLEYSLTPLKPSQNKAPTAAEVTRRITIESELLVNPKTQQTVWELNHLSWTVNSVQTPALVDIYQRGDAAVPNWEAAQANYGWDPATLSFPAAVGEVLEIVMQKTGAMVADGIVESHPFHAHGQHYYDIGSGNGTYDLAANEAKIQKLGYRPVRRDTTMLYRYEDKTTPGAAAGWRAWRIRITQPGVWMIHCHILQHMMMGKAVLFEKPVAGSLTPSQACSLSGLSGMPRRSTRSPSKRARDTLRSSVMYTATRPMILWSIHTSEATVHNVLLPALSDRTESRGPLGRIWAGL